MSNVQDNLLLAAAGDSELPGRLLRVKAGEACEIGENAVWFPLSAVLRAEIGHTGVFGGWEDCRGAVGLIARPDAAPVIAWTVQATGEVFAVPRTFVTEVLRGLTSFSDAVLAWSVRARDDAMILAAANIERDALQRVALLISDLAVIHGDDFILTGQAEIARLTGLQRTTVCGGMIRLRALDLIVYSRSRISVTDQKALREIGDGPLSSLLDAQSSGASSRFAS